MWSYNYTDELYHHGITGQKWGVRRYQNRDGSLTAAGKKRYSSENEETTEKKRSSLTNAVKVVGNVVKIGTGRKAAAKEKKEIAAEEAAKKAEEERQKLIKDAKIPAKNMTDSELKTATERLKAEQEYKRLVNDVRVSEKAKKGKVIASHIIENSAKNIGTQVAAYALGKTTNKVIEALTGEANAINPKKGQKD